jgi:hypothetical protein
MTKITLHLNEYQARNLHWLLAVAFNGEATVRRYEHGSRDPTHVQAGISLHNGDWNGEIIWALETAMHRFEQAGGDICGGPNECYPGKDRGSTWKDNALYMRTPDDQPWSGWMAEFDYSLH